MKKVVASAPLLLLIIVSIFFASCGEKKASDTVKKFYESMNKKNYAETKTYFDPELMALITSQEGSDKSLEEAFENATKGGTIEKVEIVKEDLQGEKGVINYKLTYKDGTTKEDKENVKKVKDDWKISQ